VPGTPQWRNEVKYDGEGKRVRLETDDVGDWLPLA
jgi:hypothetical protein